MPKLTIQKQKAQTQYFTEDLGNGVGLDMVLIPGGRFLMGSSEEEEGHTDWEEPQHWVAVPTFVMGRYPVTQEQYRAIANKNPTETHGAKFVAPNKPVVGVSWFDAVTFCDALSRRAGRTYRLPSEAEWEYACRAGTTTPFHFGDTITTEIANYRGTDWEGLESSRSYGNGPEGEFRNTTTPVDHFAIANAFGLCDMHGNVWEWCLDHWHTRYEKAPDDGSAWLTYHESSPRVIRGGSWIDVPRKCRSASRLDESPQKHPNDLGFRVVCEVPRL